MAHQDGDKSLKAENERLRRTLLIVVSERKKMASQITGVQNLGVQLQKKDQELRTLSEKNERLESSLARAENRITQLSHLAGNNGQTVAGQGAIVTPGVSKKLLEALTRENTKLRQALDHITNRGPGGVDLAVVSIENLVFVVNISLNICWWRGVSDAKNRELRICTITMTFLFIKRSYYKEKILLLFFYGKILGGTICQAFHFLVIVSLS